MTPSSLKHRHSGGWTAIELLIVVSIISILASVVSVSYKTMIDKAHFSKAYADIKLIAQTAYNDYTSTGLWAPVELPGDLPPSFAANGLESWPIPPCPGWSYSWDNFSGFPADYIRITLRRPDHTPLWSFCLEAYGNNCLALDAYSGVPSTEISTIDVNSFTCAE